MASHGLDTYWPVVIRVSSSQTETHQAHKAMQSLAVHSTRYWDAKCQNCATTDRNGDQRRCRLAEGRRPGPRGQDNP